MVERASRELPRGWVQEHEMLVGVDQSGARTRIVCIGARFGLGVPIISTPASHCQVTRCHSRRMLLSLLAGQNFILICRVGQAILGATQLGIVLQ